MKLRNKKYTMIGFIEFQTHKELRDLQFLKEMLEV
ncbi:MAG: hypothetical protein ACJA2M_001154 [Polaribacter sp.]|jgi:hypothetical protein|tara:strand:- start:2225 stop:2329 length:105 start_codon:yes stop_codon:yes gene_type:complete